MLTELLILTLIKTTMKKKTIAITGTQGNLGRVLKEKFLRENFHVISLNRKAVNSSEYDFSLEKPFDWQVLTEKPEILIHSAYDFSKINREEILEVNGRRTIDFLKSGKNSGIEKIIFISSMAAFDESKSIYGQVKYIVEEKVKELGGISIRPGLIWGENLRGIFGALKSIIKKFPVIPLIGNGKQILYLVHEEDLAEAIFKVAMEKISSQRIILASPEPLQFREILERMAKSLSRRVIFLPIPSFLPYIFLRFLEIIGIQPPFKSDSLISLMNQDPDPDFLECRNLKVKFRTYNST